MEICEAETFQLQNTYDLLEYQMHSELSWECNFSVSEKLLITMKQIIS